MNREHTKLSWKLRADSFVNKVKSFAASRRERSQAGGVAAQQKEKSRQIQTAAVGLTTVAAVVAGTMMLAGDDRGVRTEPVRVYKSDFRLEPEALDKQATKRYTTKSSRASPNVFRRWKSLPRVFKRNWPRNRKKRERKVRHPNPTPRCP